MKKITDKKAINYLALKGITPIKENDYVAYYNDSDRLKRLLDNYYIESIGFRNWMPLYK